MKKLLFWELKEAGWVEPPRWLLLLASKPMWHFNYIDICLRKMSATFDGFSHGLELFVCAVLIYKNFFSQNIFVGHNYWICGKINFIQNRQIISVMSYLQQFIFVLFWGAVTRNKVCIIQLPIVISDQRMLKYLSICCICIISKCKL